MSELSTNLPNLNIPQNNKFQKQGDGGGGITLIPNLTTWTCHLENSTEG